MIKKNKVYIIAEAGVNHNGSLSKALKLIEIAKKCGADAVKFQLFDKDEQISKIAPSAPYQKEKTKKKNMLQMASTYDFSWKDHIKLKKKCDKIKIDYMASCFDSKSVDFYLDKIKGKVMKIASSEIDNLRLLKYINKRCNKVILSTGMANLEEIKKAVKTLKNVKFLTILQCTSVYPASINELNLNVIKTLKKMFKLPVGFSDHSLRNTAAILSVGAGCKVIEKHFTINKNLKGPDHSMSLNPKELLLYIKNLRDCEKILGDEKKLPTKNESNLIKYSRRGLFASKDINKKEVIKKEHINYKRPASFMSIIEEKNLIGKKAKFSIKEGSALKKNMFIK